MKLSKLTLILVSIIILFANNACSRKTIENPLFVFHNAFNKAGLDTLDYSQQAAILKSLGYDGMEMKETDSLPEAIKIFRDAGLKIFTTYIKIDIENTEPYNPELKKVMPLLKGSDLILWVHLHSTEYKPSDESADGRIVEILRELSDLAEPYGVRIAVYPHIWFLAEKPTDAFRIAEKVDRENVGAVFNLCHFLKTDTISNMEATLLKVLPRLFAVSINGADEGFTRGMDWPQVIQPLGKGSLDVYPLVKLLADEGYKGPIGLQTYNLKTKPELHLAESIKTWNDYKKRYESGK